MNDTSVIHMVPIKDITPRPDNRNIHPKEQIDRLIEIIKYQGFRRPLIVSNQSGLLVCGHGRLMAAKKMKLKEVPVIYQDYENEDQEYADHVADNALQAWAHLDLSGINIDVPSLGPDFNIDMLGIKGFTIDPTEKLEPQADEDEVPEVKESFVKRGDIWQLGNHRLMCGDSTKDFPELFGNNTAAFCFTSPPYSDQRDYSGELQLDPGHLAKFLMAPCDLFAVNLGLQRKDNEIFPYWDPYIKTAKEIGLKFLSWNIWDKMESGSIGNLTAMFPIEHEWIFIFGKKTELNSTFNTASAGKLKTKRFAVREKNGSITYRPAKVTNEFKKMGTVLSMSPLKDRTHGLDHPAMFPVEFASVYIEACSDEGDLIYEPFGGSGSTLIACEKTNRKCFMMELDEHYCGVIIERFQNFTGKKAIRL